MNSELQEEINAFLFALQESGMCNMWEAGNHVRAEFPNLSQKEVRTAVLYWQKNYNELKQ